MKFNSPKKSLSDLLWEGLHKKASLAALRPLALCREEALKIANEKVDFYPEEAQKKNEEFAKRAGEQLIPTFKNDNDGAATNSFKKAFHKDSAPVSGFGCVQSRRRRRRLYLIGKSEHYRVPFGHRFGGYKLLENAHKLGGI